MEMSFPNLFPDKQQEVSGSFLRPRYTTLLVVINTLKSKFQTDFHIILSAWKKNCLGDEETSIGFKNCMKKRVEWSNPEYESVIKCIENYAHDHTIQFLYCANGSITDIQFRKLTYSDLPISRAPTAIYSMLTKKTSY